MNTLLEGRFTRNEKTVLINMSVEEFDGLATEAIEELTGVDVEGYITSGAIFGDYTSIGIWIDRIMLDPEEEDLIDFLYHNHSCSYIEPSEILTMNILSELFESTFGEVEINKITDYEGVDSYQLVLPLSIYEKHIN